MTPSDRLHEACPMCGRRPNKHLRDRRAALSTPPEPEPLVVYVGQGTPALSTPPPSLDRLRAIEYEAESWHDAIRRGDFGPGTCACNRMDGTRCSLGAALEGAPDD